MVVGVGEGDCFVDCEFVECFFVCVLEFGGIFEGVGVDDVVLVFYEMGY